MQNEWQQPGTYKQIRKGDSIRFHGDEGVLLSEPKYLTTNTSGLFYAKVQWASGSVQENFMICRVGLKWKPAEQQPKSYAKSLQKQCGWDPSGDYDAVVETAVRDLRDKLTLRVRERLMKGGSDLGGPGIASFHSAFNKGVRVQITVSSRVSLEQFIKSLDKVTVEHEGEQ